MDSYFPPDILPIRNVDLELQIARLYKESGDEKEYRLRLENQLNSNDLSLDNMFYIAQLYAQDLGDMDMAISIYNNLRIEYPDEFEIVIALVQIYSQMDRTDDALKLLNEWIMYHPNHKQSKEWLSLLKEMS